MEHANPPLRWNISHRFITIVEIMLRLTPPDYDKIRAASTFAASRAVKRTLHGDGNITDEAKSIRNLTNMSYDIKR